MYLEMPITKRQFKPSQFDKREGNIAGNPEAFLAVDWRSGTGFAMYSIGIPIQGE